MTREEVVKWLESLKKEIGKAENRTLWHYAESIDTAIEALQAKTDGDLISRQDAIKALYKYSFVSKSVIESEINAIPSAEPKTGHWIKDDLGTTICSECGRPRRDNRINHIKFCNSCGARMLGEDGE